MSLAIVHKIHINQRDKVNNAYTMTNKVALVTGSASGVGLAVALRLAKDGADLFLVDIDESGLEKAVAGVQEFGVKGVSHCADLSNADMCTQAIESAVSVFGRLDALCNVAGVMLPNHTVDMPREDFQKTLGVNLGAPFYLIQAAIPHLLESHGAIVNVASAVGITAQAYNAAYCATKAGLIQMTKSLAMEFITQPIRINAVAPGGMMTPLAMGLMNVAEPDQALISRAIPMRGLVEIDEVAGMVAYLCSDAASSYQGSCVVIDKGMCAG